MLVVANQRESLLGVWEEERSRAQTLVLDAARLLLLASALPAVDSRVLVVNLELLQLCQSQGAVRRVLAWLEELLTRVPVVGTLLLSKATSSGDRIEFKLKLLFERVVVVTPARPESFLLTPAAQFWAPVLGYQAVKQELDKLIRWRFERKASLGRMGIASSSTSHCLLHGPSGNGKTFIARNFAHLGVGFLALKASDVFSKWFGDSERKIREVFAQARERRPCILFLDEIESLAPSRASFESSSDGASGVSSRVLSTLLNEIDGVDTANEDVVVVACTNSPHLVDDALLRPGRLGCLVHVGLPDKHDRRLLLREFLSEDDGLLVDWLEPRCEGRTVLEMENLCSRAKFSALRRGSGAVDKSDFI